jgi:membrane-bound lytic murein transglycosylase A
LTFSALTFGLAACGGTDSGEQIVEFEPIPYEELNGWREDDPREAFVAFLRSCERLIDRPLQAAMGDHALLGQTQDWMPACRAARSEPAPASRADAQRFFEGWFQPFAVFADGEATGLFTGYYEPLLHGSRRFGGRYRIPLHRLPEDLVRIDLSKFDPELSGRSIRGRIEGNDLLPYHSRQEIEHGALAARGLELLWVDDEISKFFLQIQGSGKVQLEDGSTIRVGYAEQNGLPYRAIGRDLIEIGALTKEEVSLQSIKQWLKTNPEQAPEIMARNPSYIFFQEHHQLGPEDGPLGAQGVPLTAGRSLAVDPRHLPLGAPVWLETTIPAKNEGEAPPLHRLMIAQDTGGAIKGAIRGDVFWGAGDEAEDLAGHMKSEGRFFIFVPRSALRTS